MFARTGTEYPTWDNTKQFESAHQQTKRQQQQQLPLSRIELENKHRIGHFESTVNELLLDKGLFNFGIEYLDCFSAYNDEESRTTSPRVRAPNIWIQNFNRGLADPNCHRYVKAVLSQIVKFHTNNRSFSF